MEQNQFSDSKRTKSKLQKLFDEIEEEEKSKIKTRKKNKTEKKFENFSDDYCNEHYDNKIVGLCIEDNCSYNRLMCTECLFKYHVKHNMINIKDVKNKFKKLNNYLTEIDDIKEQYKKKIFLKRDQIIKTFENIINKKSNELYTLLYEKIENIYNINNLNLDLIKNYQKSFNDFKQNNQLINFWKLDFELDDKEKKKKEIFEEYEKIIENGSLFKNIENLLNDINQNV